MKNSQFYLLRCVLKYFKKTCFLGSKQLRNKKLYVPRHEKPCLLNMSPGMRKPMFCICQNKDADQLRGNCKADQRLCFCYFLYFLNSKFQASSHLQWLYSLVCVRPGQIPNCWFSHAGAHMWKQRCRSTAWSLSTQLIWSDPHHCFCPIKCTIPLLP